ncbi:MAG: hypothetical protein V1748_10740 [Actinomycetota bacterium]
MSLGTMENGFFKVEFNDPGVHPFITFLLAEGELSWAPALLLGARQVSYAHKGGSFPRVVAGGDREEDAGALVDFSPHPDGLGVAVTDARSGFEISSDLSIEPDTPWVRVEHRLTASVPVSLNRAFDRYDFVYAAGADTEPLDYVFTPHLRPKQDMVISDHVFRSPSVMLRKGDVFFALVPDLDSIRENLEGTSARHYMDLQVAGGENHSPAVCAGLGNSRVRGHIYFKADFGTPIELEAGSSVSLAYHILLDRSGLGPEDVRRFIWERYGRERLSTGRPQVVSFERYAAAGLTRIFKKPDLFKRFELEGQQCGGTIGIHFANRKGVRLMNAGQLRRYLRYQDLMLAAQRFGVEQMSMRPWAERLFERVSYRYCPAMPPEVFLQSWFNNLRSAYGAYWFARKWADHELLESALAVKNLAILAPREDGAVPAVCYPTEEGVFWSRGTRAFKHVDYYHTADCATTGYYMALWFRDHEGDPRLLARCRDLSAFLLKTQLPSGAFPAWVRPEGTGMKVDDDLRESATTACPGMFLALLYMLDRDPRCLEGARAAADFISREVIPRQKWFDYETFYSCSSKRLGLFDTYTGSYPQNTMSMYWAAEMYRLLHLATGEDGFLQTGLQVLDHLLRYQQVWDPPFLSVDAYGGFGVMNTDGEWNDSRQALMAPLLMDYYATTGVPEFMERGIAAPRASFTLMYIDENRRVAPGNMASVPPGETGSVTENYGHFGHDHGPPGFLDSDWGAGSASQAAAYAQKHYGDIFVDADRERAFGINGCTATGFFFEDGVVEMDLDRHVDTGTDLLIKIHGGTPVEEVLVNGTPAGRLPSGDFRLPP